MPLIDRLKEFGNKEDYYQHEHKNEGLFLFKTFWKTNPTEKEFGTALHGWVIFPELTYIMLKTKQED